MTVCELQMPEDCATELSLYQLKAIEDAETFAIPMVETFRLSRK